MLRRPSTNNTTPLGGRGPSLEVSHQTQIEDLVQRNRVLEQINKKLTEQLNLEQHRAKEAVAEIQKQLIREQREWREGCDVLVSCHRLAHLRTIADLEAMKSKVYEEEEAMMREKVQRLQRDVRITMFQIKESELDYKIADLEEEKEDLIAHYEEVMDNLRRRISAFVAERKAKAAEISRLEKQQDQDQDKLSQLHQDHAMLQASAESNAIKLERVTLQLEGAQTKNTDLERTNDELKRSNADLQRQLEKWQNLETKGNGELESLRKQKMALEVKVSSLQDRFDQLSADKDQDSQKTAKREDRLKKLVKQWQDEAEGNKSHKEQGDRALGEARKRIKQLETELKNASNGVTTDGDKRDEGRPVTGSGSEAIIIRSRSPPRTKKGKRINADDDPSMSDSSELQRKTKRKRTQAKLSPVSEVEEPDTRGAAKKTSEERSNTKNTSQKGKGKAEISHDDTATEDDAEQGIPQSPRLATKDSRRRKASAGDEDDVQILGSKPAPAKKPRGRPRKQKADGEVQKQAKDASKNRTDASSTEESDIATQQAPTKKKRKINIFSNPAEPTFAFMSNDIGLNIPTTLSPVKETTAIPSRSASVMNRILSKGKLR
ncbi:hypothetical protein JOM56_001471 [Amanita muscaria]